MSKLYSKRVLLIDDLEDMRKQIKGSLQQLGFGRLNFAESARDALNKITETDYDIILCDYNLGETMDGQQLLEFLRVTHRIKATTLFVMITAESGYDKVVTASEYVPDAYVLKPFTGQALGQRLEKMIDRQDTLQPLQSAIDNKNPELVISEADNLLIAKQYISEAVRAKGEALLELKQYQQVMDLYAPLVQRAIPWAMHGQALALRGMGDEDGALLQLAQLIEASPLYLSAYDLKADILLERGDSNGAFDVLRKASDISPNSLHRARVVSRAAFETGEHETAEAAMERVLKRHKYSPLKRATDFTTLSKAKAVQGKHMEAMQVLKAAENEFKADTDSAIISIGKAFAFNKAGNEKAATEALAEAMKVDPAQLPLMAVASLAEACYALGKEAEGEALLKQMVQNNPDSIEAKRLVEGTLQEHGKADQAEHLIASSEKEVIHLNNQGVRLAGEGKLDEAMALLLDAAKRLPNNQAIVGNAAYCMAVAMQKNGRVEATYVECTRLLTLLRSKNPAHPRLAQVEAILAKVK